VVWQITNQANKNRYQSWQVLLKFQPNNFPGKFPDYAVICLELTGLEDK